MAKRNPPKATAKKQAAQKKAAVPKARAADKKPAQPPATTTSDVPQQRDDSTETVVFAIRLCRFERDLVHRAAGPGKASTFVRGLALAAATGDMKTIEAIVADARN
ncbi:MAG: hypothetical protein KAY32_16770 [Candidatus Eisenbacteria sp.]|nr:hypothetical protein [Candidatus Eisenbacteria bacterium]